jgi:hypothetical protein
VTGRPTSAKNRPSRAVVTIRSIAGSSVALQDHFTDKRATDLLWFYFGHQSWHTLVAELGWTWDEAEEWLRERAATDLLKPR